MVSVETRAGFLQMVLYHDRRFGDAGLLSRCCCIGGVVPSRPSSPDNIILTYTFKAGLTEIAGGPSLSQPLLSRPTLTFSELINRLTEAAKDKRVKGFRGKVAGFQSGSGAVAGAARHARRFPRRRKIHLYICG